MATVPLFALARRGDRVRIGGFTLPLLRIRKRRICTKNSGDLQTWWPHMGPWLPSPSPPKVGRFWLLLLTILNFHNRLVREFIPDVVLGLFVHTPFPSSEVFRCLPSEISVFSRLFLRFLTLLSGRKEILDGMLGASLICFQVRHSPIQSFLITD